MKNVVMSGWLLLGACAGPGAAGTDDGLEEACFGEKFFTDSNGTELNEQRSVDVRGRPLESLSMGGETNDRVYYDYDGLTVTASLDYGDDGTIEEVTRTTHNVHGDLVELEDHLGNVEERTYAYDEEGHQVSSQRSLNGDLQTTTTLTWVEGRPTAAYQLDAEGNRVGETTWDYDGAAPSLNGSMTIHPGILPSTTVYQRTYDDSDHMLREEQFNDGSFVLAAEQLWSTTGVLLERSTSDDNDGWSVTRNREDGLPDYTATESTTQALVTSQWEWDCVTEVHPDL